MVPPASHLDHGGKPDAPPDSLARRTGRHDLPDGGAARGGRRRPDPADAADQRADRRGVEEGRDQEAGRQVRRRPSSSAGRSSTSIGRIATPEEVIDFERDAAAGQARSGSSSGCCTTRSTRPSRAAGRPSCSGSQRRQLQGGVRRALGQPLDRLADDPVRQPHLPRPDQLLAHLGVPQRHQPQGHGRQARHRDGQVEHQRRGQLHHAPPRRGRPGRGQGQDWARSTPCRSPAG